MATNSRKLTTWAGVLLGVIAIVTVLSGCPSCQGHVDEGDAFVVLMDSSPRGLDPRFATTDASAKLVALLHEGLLSTDTADGSPELRLAEKIEQKGPLVYEIWMRDDATFHDGAPVTAEDVEYTYMQLSSDLVNSPLGGMSRRIETFEIVDAHHIRITLKHPHAPFLTDLSMGIVPRHLCEGHSECVGDPVGAGPFRFVGRDGDLRFEFHGYEDYFGGAPEIERLVFRVVRDDNARLLALLGDTADLVQNAVAPLMIPVVEGSDRLEVQMSPSFKYTYLAFNLEHPILQDNKVRKAIAHAIDREEIITYKFREAARLSTGLLPPDHWAYESDVARYEYDPEKARRLLDEAGYPSSGEGPRFELEFKVSSNKFRRSLTELMAQQLGEVGIDVRVRSYEWGTFFDDIRSRNFEMTTLQWPSVSEPSLYRWIFHSENIPSAENRAAGANRGAYANARVDELLEQGDREPDREKRRQIYGEVQQILAEELPYISLWHEDNIAILRRGTAGYYTTPNARFDALRSVRPVTDLTSEAPPSRSVKR